MRKTSAEDDAGVDVAQDGSNGGGKKKKKLVIDDDEYSIEIELSEVTCCLGREGCTCW